MLRRVLGFCLWSVFFVQASNYVHSLAISTVEVTLKFVKYRVEKKLAVGLKSSKVREFVIVQCGLAWRLSIGTSANLVWPHA